MKRELVIYIAGPFRGRSAWEIEVNIRNAERLALEVWKLGMVALCPHCNTRYFQGELEDDAWLVGDLELLRRCDALLVGPGWQQSAGTRGEIDAAVTHGIPVFYTLMALDLAKDKLKVRV